MSTDLRSRLVRLAYTNEAIRPHLLPLLGETRVAADTRNLWLEIKDLADHTIGHGEWYGENRGDTYALTVNSNGDTPPPWRGSRFDSISNVLRGRKGMSGEFAAFLKGLDQLLKSSAKSSKQGVEVEGPRKVGFSWFQDGEPDTASVDISSEYGFEVAYIRSRYAHTKQADLPVGKTYESDEKKLRMHRYTGSLQITDLTNAGKRGKRVRQTSVYDLDAFRDAQVIEDWDRMIDNLPKAPSYDAVIKIIRGHVVSLEMFNPTSYVPKMEERELRGVDVAPASFAPMKIETPEFELEAGYDSFSVMDKRDTNNLPACIPSSRGGKGAVKQFFRWVTDNESRITRMTYNELTSAMLDEGLEFHSYCRMD